MNHRVIRVDTRHGPMWVFEEDEGCSRILREYGEYSEAELQVMRSSICPEDTVLDAGANIGAFTIPLARLCKKVYACEPQFEVHEVLERNLLDNDIKNVEILPFALGFQEETRYYSPNPAATGSIQMLDKGDRPIDVKPLDSLGLTLNFIKADVEGMECHLLAGGRETIAKYKPPILAERSDPNLVMCLNLLGYTVATVDLPIFVRNNHRGCQTNYYPNQAHLMTFAVPQDWRVLGDKSKSIEG